MIDFYNQLIAYKAKNKLSWEHISKIIGKKKDAVRMAVKNESLTLKEVELISKEYNIGHYNESLGGSYINSEDGRKILVRDENVAYENAKSIIEDLTRKNKHLEEINALKDRNISLLEDKIKLLEYRLNITNKRASS